MKRSGDGSSRPTPADAEEADELSPITKIFDEGIEIDAALQRAARDALLAHKQKGLPVPMWIDGKTVWVPPEEIEIPEEIPTRQR